MGDRLKRLFKYTDMSEERAFAVNVDGCADFIGDTLERDFLAVETSTTIFEMMHSGEL